MELIIPLKPCLYLFSHLERKKKMNKATMLETIGTLWLLMSSGLLTSITSAMLTKSLSFKFHELSLAQNMKSTKQRESSPPIHFKILPKAPAQHSGPWKGGHRRTSPLAFSTYFETLSKAPS